MFAEWVFRAVALGMVTGMLALAVPPAAAVALAQATPETATPVAPGPEECRVARRPLPLLPPVAPGAPAATPAPIASPAPVAPPAGESADAATVAGVTATVREALACRNAGDFRRAYALMTDAMLVRLFGSAATIDPEIRAALSGPNQRVPRGQRLALVSVSGATVGADGRVAAVVETAGGGATYRDLLYFVRVGDRWLIDEAVALGATGGTPAPA